MRLRISQLLICKILVFSLVNYVGSLVGVVQSGFGSKVHGYFPHKHCTCKFRCKILNPYCAPNLTQDVITLWINLNLHDKRIQFAIYFYQVWTPSWGLFLIWECLHVDTLYHWIFLDLRYVSQVLLYDFSGSKEDYLNIPPYFPNVFLWKGTWYVEHLMLLYINLLSVTLYTCFTRIGQSVPRYIYPCLSLVSVWSVPSFSFVLLFRLPQFIAGWLWASIYSILFNDQVRAVLMISAVRVSSEYVVKAFHRLLVMAVAVSSCWHLSRSWFEITFGKVPYGSSPRTLYKPLTAVLCYSRSSVHIKVEYNCCTI